LQDFSKHGKAASYQQDKARTATRVIWFHYLPQRKGNEMKNYRNALTALVFAFVFSTSAFADDGIMHTDKTLPTPTPTATSTAQSLATDGIIHGDVAEPAPEAADTVTEIALSLLQSVLSLV
jgi:hypothetical protein